MAVADGALLGVRDRPMALKRFVDGITGEAFFQKRAPKSVPECVTHRGAGLPIGPHRRRGGRLESRPRWPGWRTWAASTSTRIRCAPTTSTIPTSCASTSIRGPACRGPTSGAWRWSCARSWPITAWSAGRRPPARAASTSTPGSSRAGASPRCGAPRWRWRARSSGAPRRSPPASGGRRSGTASSSTTTRTPRTAPWRPPIRCGPMPDAHVSAPLTWDEVPDAELGDFTLRTMPAATRSSATWARGSTTRVGSLDALLELSERDEAQGLATRHGRRTTRSSRASRHACSRQASNAAARWRPPRAGAPAISLSPCRRPRRGDADGTVAPTGRRRSTQPLIVISQAKARADALDGLERWKSVIRRRPSRSPRTTCWSTGCAAARRCGIGSA